MVTKEEIIDACKEYQKDHPHWRWGQIVFNYIDVVYGVARIVQFDDHVDCFYNNTLVEPFIEHSLNYINNKD